MFPRMLVKFWSGGIFAALLEKLMVALQSVPFLYAMLTFAVTLNTTEVLTIPWSRGVRMVTLGSLPLVWLRVTFTFVVVGRSVAFDSPKCVALYAATTIISPSFP